MCKEKCKLVLLVLLSTIVYCTTYSQTRSEWKMQPVSLQTRWAKEVSPENALPEYPRPQMVREGKWLNLNGLWDFAVTPRDAEMPKNYQGKILVPFPIESALSGVKKTLLPTECLWYRRSVNKAVSEQSKRTLLNFGAVDWQATIFLNGKEVGNHSGGYTSFTIDITDQLKLGDNELVVKVYDPTDTGINPRGKQTLNPANIYYTSTSGIWQTVWLETVPDNYISGIKMSPNIDKGILTVTVSAPVGTTVELIAKGGKSESGRIIGEAGIPLALQLKNIKLWSPEDPFLYDLEVKLSKGGKTIDKITSYFGMRKIAIAKDSKGIERIFLNNKPYFNFGTLDQGFWPEGLYTAPTDSALKFDIQAIKSIGFNTIRKHIKVEPARWYYHADKLGILVWQDFVNPPTNLPEGSKVEFEKETKETIQELYNHPSITTWVLFNEKWGQYDQQRLTKVIKQSDSTRIVNGHSGEYLYVNDQLRSPSPNAYVDADMTDVHSYPNPRLSIKQDGKAMVCGEFGGIGVPILGHQWDDLNGWGYVQVKPKELVEKYTDMLKAVKNLKESGLSASIYTQPFDVESEENGLITYDREIIKIPVARLREIHKEVNNISGNNAPALSFESLNDNVDEKVDQYVDLLGRYDKGERDSVFLRRLYLLAIKRKDQNRATQIGNSFIGVLTDVFSKENLLFISKTLRTYADTGFSIFLTNLDRVDKVLGDNLAKTTVRTIIYTEIIVPLREKRIKADYSEIESRTVKMYGEFAEAPTWQALAGYAWEIKDASNFVKYKNKLHAKYPEEVSSVFYLNNDAWFVFENATKRTDIESALVWQEKVIKEDSLNANVYDTYANLLHKLGRTKEAIMWEEKAVKMDPESQWKKTALERMKLALEAKK